MNNKGNLFTEEEYNLLRTLIGNRIKFSQAKALKLTDRSPATWDRVKKYNTWKEYKESNEQHRLYQLAKKEGKSKANGKSDILTEGNVLLENTILLQSIAKLQGSIDKLNAKLGSFGQNEKTFVEKVFGKLG